MFDKIFAAPCAFLPSSPYRTGSFYMSAFRGFRRPSKRDDAISFNAAERFYAGAGDKEATDQRIIKPKRERIRRPVDGLPPKASEHDEQKNVINWWRKAHGTYQLPELALFSVPNGSFLGSSYFSAAKLKSEGLRRGALDLILAKPNRKYHGLFIEMKAGDNKTSDDQDAFIAYLTSAGYKASVHWGADSAIEEIKSYLVYDETMALIPCGR